MGAEAAPKVALLLDGNYQHELTGSLTSTGNITSPNITADSSSFSTRVTANDAKVSMVIGTAANQAKAGNTTTISGAQASSITANTAKTGITTSQANAITANTAKIGLSTGELEEATLTATAMGNTDEGYKIRFSLTIEGADAALNGDLALR